MIKLTYTLVGEGFAEYAFIPAYLKRITEKLPLQLIKSPIRIAISANPSASKVIEKAGQLGEQALIGEQHDLLIIGIDLDQADYPPELVHHQKRLAQLSSPLTKLLRKFGNKIVLYVPIQAFDHWLYYQYHKVDSKVSKPADNSLESKHQEEIKKKLYGNKEANRLVMERVAKSVAEKADFDELAKQSRSFNHFHRQVVTFLTAHKTTQP